MLGITKIRVNSQVVSLFLVIVFSGITNAETGHAPEPEAILFGKQLYEKHCQVCHQKDGVGEPPIPWGIRKAGYFTAMPLNETSHAWHHTDEQLANMILEGLRRTDRMPAFKQVLSGKEVDDIVAYIKSLWSPRIVACQGPKHMTCR
ncbi:MAG: c-type cytochrome [Acidiferrobacterales bacterium]